MGRKLKIASALLALLVGTAYFRSDIDRPSDWPRVEHELTLGCPNLTGEYAASGQHVDDSGKRSAEPIGVLFTGTGGDREHGRTELLQRISTVRIDGPSRGKMTIAIGYQGASVEEVVLTEDPKLRTRASFHCRLGVLRTAESSQAPDTYEWQRDRDGGLSVKFASSACSGAIFPLCTAHTQWFHWAAVAPKHAAVK